MLSTSISKPLDYGRAMHIFINILAAILFTGILPVPIALSEELVVVMSRKATVDALNKRQIRRLFLGKSKTLPNGERAIILDNASNNDLRDQFYKELIGKSGERLESYWSKLKYTGRGQPPEAINDVKKLKEAMNDSPNVVSYMAKSKVSKDIKVVFKLAG